MSAVDSDLVYEASMSLVKFSEYCFTFPYENMDFHERWYNTIENPENKSGLIIAPRNSAKSTCWAKVAPLYLLGRNPDLRIVLISRTSTLAQTNLRFLRLQIESNDRVREVFPFKEINGRVYGLKPSSPWGSETISVENNRRDGVPSVYAVGLEGSISGIRADLIIVDDLIDQNNVMTDSQREKVGQFWDTVVTPTLNPDGRIFAVGTRYHSKDFYSRLLEDDMYKDNTSMFPALKLAENGEYLLDSEGNMQSYWPKRWSVSKLLDMKERMGSLAFNCLTENNKIITQNGFKMVRDIKVGDLVLTHEDRWKSVEHSFSKISDEPIHKVYVFGDPEPMEITESHKVWSFKSRQYKSKSLAPWNGGISDFVDNIINESLGWNEIKDLDNRDFMIFPIDKTVKESKYVDEDFWWMVGLYLAEGCLNHSNKRIVFTLASHEVDFAERVVKTAAKFGSKASIRMKKTSLNVDFSNIDIYNFLYNYGHLAHNKHLTQEAMQLPLYLQKAMWDGYVAGDGCDVINPAGNRGVSVTSVSLDLLRGFKMILLRLGLVGFVGKTGKGGKRMFKGRSVNQLPTYRLWLNLDTERKRPAEIHDGYLYTRIRYKEIKFTGERVYDIQVKDDHSFTVIQGVISNSQYQCDPSGYAGRLFDPEHIQFYDPIKGILPIWGDLDFYMSVDPNITDDPSSDNTAIVTGAVDRKRGDLYVLDIFAKPLDFVGQVKELMHYGNRAQVSVGSHRFESEIKISKIGVEAVAYQRSLQQTGYLSGLPVVEIKQGNRKKDVRILGIQPHIENGRVKFPDPDKVNIPWWDAFYEEYCTFPKGRRDDRLDALEILVSMVSESFGTSGIPWGPSGDGLQVRRGGRFMEEILGRMIR